jgi:outer membrane protein assembly factor BamA
MLRSAVVLALLCPLLAAQQQSFPLEAVVIEGSALPKETIIELTGFRLGTPVNEAAIEAGCKKLEETGLFQDIGYRYAPGPQRGYVVTITLKDQPKLREATIDIPGVNEEQLWQWVIAKYPPFNHKVPDTGASQEFMAKLIEQHASAALLGQHVVGNLEEEFTPRPRTIVSFQPASLPAIARINFTGAQKLSADQLNAIMLKVIGGQGYMDRRFRGLVELNLRPAYEEAGMYRVRFPEITSQKAGESSVSVTVAIEEGAQFTLGAVAIAGDDLPRDEMLKAGNLKSGVVANWTQIQQGIWDMERPVKRLGYFAARSRSARVLHDDTRILDVNVAFEKGPMYHVGDVRFTGLTPELEAQARKVWSAALGAPYDFLYPNDFLRDFSRVTDFRQFKKYNAQTQPGSGDHVINITMVFESK